MIDVFEPIRSKLDPSKPPRNDDEHVVDLLLNVQVTSDTHAKHSGSRKSLTSMDNKCASRFPAAVSPSSSLSIVLLLSLRPRRKWIVPPTLMEHVSDLTAPGVDGRMCRTSNVSIRHQVVQYQRDLDQQVPSAGEAILRQKKTVHNEPATDVISDTPALQTRSSGPRAAQLR